MNKILCMLLATIALVNCSKKDDPIDKDPIKKVPKIFDGDVYLETQKQVDSFAKINYTQINGELRIGDPNFVSDITKLNALNSLTKLQSLNITTDKLNTLDGFENLDTITNDFLIRSVGAKQSLKGLNKLKFIGGNFSVYRTSALRDFEGLENLKTVKGTFELSSIYEPITFKGLDNLRSVGALTIEYVSEKIDLEGLESLNEIKNNIVICNNDLLKSLKGLDNLIKVNKVFIGIDPDNTDRANEVLANYCPIQNLINNGSYKEIVIKNNLYNPSIDELKTTKCRK